MFVILVKGPSKQWHVRVAGNNGQIALVSETYKTRWNAKRAAKRLAKLFKLEFREVEA